MLIAVLEALRHPKTDLTLQPGSLHFWGRPHWGNQALYRDLATLLAQSDLAGYGQAIGLIARDKVFPESEDIAYYTAFQRVIFAVKNFAYHAGDIAELTSM
jgi:hypothetical protein